MHISANYNVVSLTGTTTEGQLGNGITASTIHRVYCLSTGTVTITPQMGDIFTWSATTNTFMDVVVKGVTVNSGTFIGFKAKFQPHQFGPFASL